MKFVRNAKIFRGHLDAAPAVGVFFLFALMVLLHSTITFTPGLLLQLGEVGKGTNAVPVLKIGVEGQAYYKGDPVGLGQLGKLWLEQAIEGKAPPLVWLATEPGTPPKLVAEFERIADEASVIIKPLSTRLEMPETDELPGTTHASLVVALNLNGQLFFENQMIDIARLSEKFVAAQKNSREPLTLVLQADRGVEYGKVVALSILARKSGFAEVLFATRPYLRPSRPPAVTP